MARKDSDDDQTKDEKSNGSEDNFGLPDIEFKPLDEPIAAKPDEGTQGDSGGLAGAPSDTFDSYAVDETKSKAPIILTIVIILVVAIAGYLIYNFVYIPRAEKQKQEQLAKQKALRDKQEADRIAKEKAAAEEQRKRDEALANVKPAIGTIEILSERTRRYYVIVSSDIDDDLLMDYAKKLSTTGLSTKIIPPFGGKKFYRLAIADQDTFASAQASADESKATYGPAVWVLKY